MKGIDVQRLTILGDRHHGKTHTLNIMALDFAEHQGLNVYYQCQGRLLTQERFHEVQRLATFERIVRISRSNGRENILFDNEAMIWFCAPIKGESIAAHLVDDVPGVDLVWPGARYFVRTALR